MIFSYKETLFTNLLCHEIDLSSTSSEQGSAGLSYKYRACTPPHFLLCVYSIVQQTFCETNSNALQFSSRSISCKLARDKQQLSSHRKRKIDYRTILILDLNYNFLLPFSLEQRIEIPVSALKHQYLSSPAVTHHCNKMCKMVLQTSTKHVKLHVGPHRTHR